jgi:hypothetical protein
MLNRTVIRLGFIVNTIAILTISIGCNEPATSFDQGSALASELFGGDANLTEGEMERKLLDGSRKSKDKEQFYLGFSENGTKLVWDKINKINQETNGSGGSHEDVRKAFKKYVSNVQKVKE